VLFPGCSQFVPDPFPARGNAGARVSPDRRRHAGNRNVTGPLPAGSVRSLAGYLRSPDCSNGAADRPAA